MTFLVGLPSFVAVGALAYLAAESQSRAVAFAVCSVLAVWLLVSLRRDARRNQAGTEDPAKPKIGERASDSP